jgi:hypothetical protein
MTAVLLEAGESARPSSARVLHEWLLEEHLSHGRGGDAACRWWGGRGRGRGGVCGGRGDGWSVHIRQDRATAYLDRHLGSVSAPALSLSLSRMEAHAQ